MGVALFYFCKATSVTHVSDVSKERAILNFAIQKKLSVNVGKIIEQSIVGFATGRLSCALGHPSLICQLCERVGVDYREDEETQDPLPILDGVLLSQSRRKSKSSAPTVPPMARAADLRPERTSSEAGPSQPVSQADPGYAELQSQIKDLQLAQRELQASHNDLRLSHNRFVRRTSRQMEYMVDVCKTFATAFQSGSLPSSSSSSLSFPVPPDVSPYQSGDDVAGAGSD